MASDWAYLDCLQYLGNNLNRDDGRYGQTEALYREVACGWTPASTTRCARASRCWAGTSAGVDAAMRYLEDDIRFDPSNDRARLYLVGLAYEKARDPAKMIESLEPELVRPDVPEMLLRMVGNVYLKGRDWKGALAYWTWVRGRARRKTARLRWRIGPWSCPPGLAEKGRKP